MSEFTDITCFQSMTNVAENYDAFIIDVWGVLHDGVSLYSGVVETLENLTKMSKSFIMLTNAPRRSIEVATAMVDMGLPRKFCNQIFSSGEVTYLDLKLRKNNFYKTLGNQFLHVGPKRDRSLFAGLEWVEVHDVENCDLIINTGPWSDNETVSQYEALLHKGAEKGVPMICANPDLEVIRGGKKIICAGSLAAKYEEFGGNVRWFGKPREEIYQYCFDALEGFEKDKIAAIGDSLRTDISGARCAGIDPILVCNGIHREALCDDYGTVKHLHAVKKLCSEWGVTPRGLLPDFRW